MATKEQIVDIIAQAKSLQSSLEIAETLEKEHGLTFTEDEKATLRGLRENLPKLEMLFARLPH